MTVAVELERALAAGEADARARSQAGEPLGKVLEELLLTAEIAAGGGMVASILLVDDSGERLRHGAAPNLPAVYCAAIDGIRIGPGVGSCGTAAFLGHPVYVTDIERDELWADFRDLALRYGLRACWSSPFADDSGAVIGTFAIYHHTPRSPTPVELDAVAAIANAVRGAVLDHRRFNAGARPGRALDEPPSFASDDDEGLP
ncbi:GAF domain-containing protein [Caulobacter segnis]|uniref:GAF domain-containing protein n=1 Tax=Caulobacter segnis TaxID=88688 RepID=UPI00285F9A29|nr:GAF domain-containing protein [Caulobacter segnis]MDR6624519.1 GAF domain-containing protein [Caulobacter segnis]